MTRWRQRLGDDKLTELIRENLSAAERTSALRLKDVKRVIVDTTVQPKNIAFPTDAKLLYSSMIHLGRLCRRHGIKLRQTYVRVGKRALIKAQCYAHAKQFKRHRREVKFLVWDPDINYLIFEAEMAEEPAWGIRHGKGIYALGRPEDGKRVRGVVMEQRLTQGGEPSAEELREALIAAYWTDFGIHDVTWL